LSPSWGKGRQVAPKKDLPVTKKGEKKGVSSRQRPGKKKRVEVACERGGRLLGEKKKPPSQVFQPKRERASSGMGRGV